MSSVSGGAPKKKENSCRAPRDSNVGSPVSDLDLFTDKLWINDGSGSLTAATGGPTGGSAAAWGDADGDGEAAQWWFE